MAKGFFFDMTSCIGCKTCQIACKDKNDLPIGTLFRHIVSYETGDFPKPGVFHYPGSCNHCGNPACVAACPMRTLDFGEMSDLMAKYPDAVSIAELPFMPESDTVPATLVLPKKLALEEEAQVIVI